MIAITGNVVGAEVVIGHLNALYPERAVQRLRTSVHGLGFLLEQRVKLEKLNGQVLKRQSGRLARSINTLFVDTPTSSTASVGTNVSYGRIWELTGSRAFTIVPRNGQALYWKGAAHPVRSVSHPAQSPRPFLKPALEEMRPTIRETIDRAMQTLGGAS